MILKILLVLAVISLIYFMFIKKKPLSYNKDKKDDKSQSNDLVQCVTCGTYTELNESIISNNKYYCSNECVGKA